MYSQKLNVVSPGRLTTVVLVYCCTKYFITRYVVVATMQFVVTGQAPVTLDRKITSQEENKEKQKITQTNRVYTKKGRSAYVHIKIHLISYAKRVAAETETEETA